MGEEEKQGEGEGPEPYPYGEYEGGRDENLDRHGWGSALLPNGDIYEGNYKHGLRTAEGMYCFRNGSRYDGEWRKGKKHGQGQFLYPDGTRYVGQWRKDNKHGQGSYFYINGDTYEGSWFKNFRHGLGTYTYKKDNITHFVPDQSKTRGLNSRGVSDLGLYCSHGTWKNGRMEGPGIINYPGYRYHGKFDKNLPTGPGCFAFENKWMQHGFYLNVRDPAFDYVGADELALEETKEPEDQEYRGNPRGIVPIWRARIITAYKPELLPLEPVPLPVKDSLDSLDIMDYLEQQYKEGVLFGEEEEGGENYHKHADLPPPPSPDPVPEAPQ